MLALNNSSKTFYKSKQTFICNTYLKKTSLDGCDHEYIHKNDCNCAVTFKKKYIFSYVYLIGFQLMCYQFLPSFSDDLPLFLDTMFLSLVATV